MADGLMRQWDHVVDQPELVDAALDDNHPHAGVALLVLVLNHTDPSIVLPRIKLGLASPSAQTRANALQSLGHHARLHRTVDAESVDLIRGCLRDRTRLGGVELCGYGGNAGGDVGMFAPRGSLPRWFRRRFPGPRRPRH